MVARCLEYEIIELSIGTTRNVQRIEQFVLILRLRQSVAPYLFGLAIQFEGTNVQYF